jgi:hypothetical protein
MCTDPICDPLPFVGLIGSKQGCKGHSQHGNPENMAPEIHPKNGTSWHPKIHGTSWHFHALFLVWVTFKYPLVI